MKLLGLPFGVSSEGSYGPHPYIPFIPGGRELMVFIDDERGIEVRQALVVSRTNFDSHICAPGDAIEPFLTNIGFPAHALVVQPHQPIQSPSLIAQVRVAQTTCPSGVGKLQALSKGVRDPTQLRNAIDTAAAFSLDGQALLVTDMRAHLNPSRMAMIRVTAAKLARRIACICPHCQTPGFGIVDVARGLPCADCGEPTQDAVAEIHRCSACAHERNKPLRRDDERASPGHCEFCNP